MPLITEQRAGFSLHLHLYSLQCQRANRQLPANKYEGIKSSVLKANHPFCQSMAASRQLPRIKKGGSGEQRFKSRSGGVLTTPFAVESETHSLTAEDDNVIHLHVEGMTCGGCVASVKRILEGLPQVSLAAIDLDTQGATIWTIPELHASKYWKQDIGESLAKHLTNCGFKSRVRHN
uniref:HMA domain-containing protein n=1 Tax=Araucaria cunninghamii TaxID=56994 RepID=A0A0D6R6Y0_ARACU